jgi:hypothetical protein
MLLGHPRSRQSVPPPSTDQEPAGRVDRPSPEEPNAVTAAWDLVDEWGVQSFPASDPPANW